jgi:hypothetical protein
MGCSSLFPYCTQVLHLSEHAAYLRIEAARAARKYPVLLERLDAGEITLTAVSLLASQGVGCAAPVSRPIVDNARGKRSLQASLSLTATERTALPETCQVILWDDPSKAPLRLIVSREC